MDELIDVLDAQGNPTGKTCLKSVAHMHGHYHATVHVWLYTKYGQVLMQQRGFNKKTYPGLWDVSVAGHIHAGETIEQGAIREVKEEISLTVRESDLQKIAVRKGQRKHPNGIKDNEFYHVFLLELKTDFCQLKKQDEEVANITLFDLEILKGTSENFPMVPDTSEYFQFIASSIQSILQ